MLQQRLARVLPFYYGRVILACAMCASFARQAAAVATLSVFIVPMTAEFDWSRSEISGAVTAGGILAALVSPWLGALVDRHGARVILTLSTLAIAGTAMALAMTQSLLWFYLMFSVGRMIFASPFDLGISAAVANWFVRRRAAAMSGVSLATGVSLAAMPFIAQFAIDASGWRTGWIAVAVAVLVVGAFPNAVLMARRPEDLELRPDGTALPARSRPSRTTARGSGALPPEPAFTLRQALRTPALWLLMVYSALIFLVQAGVSLHQAPHLVQRGLDPTIAASVVSTFALMAAISGLGFGMLGGRWPIRFGLALAAMVMAGGAVLMAHVSSAPHAYLAGAVFGAGIGGILTLVPVSFADYFGRASYATIRGVALPVQVAGQALGPLFAGALYDHSGDYHLALMCFAGFAVLAAGLGLLARRPLMDPAPDGPGANHRER